MDLSKDIAWLLSGPSFGLGIWGAYEQAERHPWLAAILLFVGFLALYRLAWGFVNRNHPVRMIFTVTEISPDKDDWAKVVTRRRQMVRANRRNVNQVRMGIAPSFNETLNREDITLGVEYGSPSIDQNKHDYIRTGANSWICYQKFDPCLPYQEWGYLIPDFLLRIAAERKWKWGEKLCIIRNVTVVYQGNWDEIKGEEQYLQIASDRYVQKRVTIKYHGRNVALSGDEDETAIYVFARKINDSAVEIQKAKITGGQGSETAEFSISRMRPGTTFGVFWKFGNQLTPPKKTSSTQPPSAT